MQHQKQQTTRIRSIPKNAATMAIMNSDFSKSTCNDGCSSISHKVGSKKSQLTLSTPRSTKTYKKYGMNNISVDDNLRSNFGYSRFDIGLRILAILLPCMCPLAHLSLTPKPCHNNANLLVQPQGTALRFGTSTSF